MSLSQLRNVDFGSTKANLTGASGVGYTLYSYDGSISQVRTTTGVYQLTSGSGIYAAYISFPDSYHGTVLWDTGELTGSRFAAEQYNAEENNPKIDAIYTDTQYLTGTLFAMSGSVEKIRKLNEGRWKITSNQMIFYSEDNVTEVARFNLFDDVGAATMDSVFERVKV